MYYLIILEFDKIDVTFLVRVLILYVLPSFNKIEKRLSIVLKCITLFPYYSI